MGRIREIKMQVRHKEWAAMVQECQASGTLRVTERQKGRTIMIDAMYNYRQGDIHSAEFGDAP